jgi:hypothetical protein
MFGVLPMHRVEGVVDSSVTTEEPRHDALFLVSNVKRQSLTKVSLYAGASLDDVLGGRISTLCDGHSQVRELPNAPMAFLQQIHQLNAGRSRSTTDEHCGIQPSFVCDTRL